MFRFILACSLVVAGCASNDPPPPGGDAAIDCPLDQHQCGTQCVDDRANEPDVGCRFGCGNPCPNPAGGSARCTTAGECSVECVDPFVLRNGTCECTETTCTMAGAECGMVDDGCGRMLNCGSCGGGRDCVDNACSCDADDKEPNETDETADDLGAFTDAPPAMAELTELTLNSMDDVDYFEAMITDGNMPTLTIDLEGVPTSHDYEIAAWYTCNSGPNTTQCRVGTANADHGVGCASPTGPTRMARIQLQPFCDGASGDKSGTLLIRVRSTTWDSECMPYTLQLAVD